MPGGNRFTGGVTTIVRSPEDNEGAVVSQGALESIDFDQILLEGLLAILGRGVDVPAAPVLRRARDEHLGAGGHVGIDHSAGDYARASDFVPVSEAGVEPA